MWTRLSIVLLGVVIAFGAAAQGAKKGDNGGEVVVMEGHPIEFVTKGQEIAFYILEDDAKKSYSHERIQRPCRHPGWRQDDLDCALAGRAQCVLRTASNAARLQSPRGLLGKGAGPHPPGTIHDRLAELVCN